MSAPVPAASVLQLRGLQLRGGELRLRLLERDPVGRRVDPEQDVAALHLRCRCGRTTCAIGPFTCALTETMSCFTWASSVDDAAAAGQPVIAAADDQQRRHDQHQDRAQRALACRQASPSA